MSAVQWVVWKVASLVEMKVVGMAVQMVVLVHKWVDEKVDPKAVVMVVVMVVDSAE